METKINIAASQNDNGLFNLVISKVTTVEGEDPTINTFVKTDVTIEEVKSYINEL